MKKLLFFDVETTGLNHETAEIVSWAALPWDDGKRGPVRVDTFRALGNLDAPNAKAALAINKYEVDKREYYPPMQAGFVQAIFGMIVEADGLLVGWNPTFDWLFLTTAAKRLGVPLPEKRVRLIDVSSMALPLFAAGIIPGLSLSLASTNLLNKVQDHTAAGDVALTADVFEALFVRYWAAIKPVSVKP